MRRAPFDKPGRLSGGRRAAARADDADRGQAVVARGRRARALAAALL